MSWPTVSFGDVLTDVTGGNVKTKQSDYLTDGKYAIVDQGQSVIGGYTDDETSLCKVDSPVIIFGDHTKALKYVDFPFCLGADGTKVLKPKPGTHAKYLYYALHQVPIPEAGYSRHFKYLKTGEIPLPPLEEQKRIAGILEQAAELYRLRTRALDKLNTLGQAIFHEMFGDPVNSASKYERRPLKEYVNENRPITYGILKPGPDTPGGVPYIRVVDMVIDEIDQSSVRRTTLEIAGNYVRSRLRAGDLLMSIRGHVGRTSIVPAELEGANITQDTARLAVPSDEAEFFRYSILHPGTQEWMRRRTKGAAVKGINLGDLRELPVPYAPHDERIAFCKKLVALRSKLTAHRKACAHSQALFASLQHRAFRGKL